MRSTEVEKVLILSISERHLSDLLRLSEDTLDEGREPLEISEDFSVFLVVESSFFPEIECEK